MLLLEKEFFFREDDGELLGVIARDKTSWLAQTIFGYTIARIDSRQDAETILLEKGLSSLMGTWQYLDPDEKSGFRASFRRRLKRRSYLLGQTNMVCRILPPINTSS